MAHKRNYITDNGVCQLLDKSKYLNNDGYINNGNGTITTKSIPQDYMRFYDDFDIDGSVPTPKELSIAYRTYGHKVLILDSGNNSPDGGLKWEINSTALNAGASFAGQGEIFTNNKLPLKDIIRSYFYIVNPSGYAFTCAPQLFDLTEMFGAGNEPTTVAEFKTKYPDELYSYNRLVSTCCKKMIKVANVCQLLDKSKYPATTTKDGVTFTNNDDGTITVNGTATTAVVVAQIDLLRFNPTVNHIYLCLGCPSGGGRSRYRLEAAIYDNSNHWKAAFSDTGNGGISSNLEEDRYITIRIQIYDGYTANNLVFKPQLFDLTEMYGAGNEPTTVSEFKTKFPDELYPYQPYCFAPITSTNYIGKTKNLFDNVIVSANCQVSFSTSRAIATQINADNATSRTFKIAAYNGSSYEMLSWKTDAFALGKIIRTFTTPETTGYKFIIIGLNGVKIDTTCQCNINLKPSTTYTFSCNFTNITQGSISWTDMQLEEGSTATPYVPYEYV